MCPTGGAEEAQGAYDEAMNAIFNLQVECHRHTQPHKSKKDGSTKWAIIEMWPMLVRALPHLSQTANMRMHLPARFLWCQCMKPAKLLSLGQSKQVKNVADDRAHATAIPS